MTNAESLTRPFIPFHLKPICMAKKGCRNIYDQINCQNFETKYKDKWNLELDLQINKLTWKHIFHICFKSVYNDDLVWLQYKILHRILGTQRLMLNMKITDSDLCRLCNSCSETLLHLLVNCNHVVRLWRNLESWLKMALNMNFTFTSNDIILGYLINSNISTPINVIIMVTKKYIFSCAYRNITPNIQQLIQKLTCVFQEERLAYINMDKENIFFKKWEKMLMLFH